MAHSNQSTRTNIITILRKQLPHTSRNSSTSTAAESRTALIGVCLPRPFHRTHRTEFNPDLETASILLGLFRNISGRHHLHPPRP